MDAPRADRGGLVRPHERVDDLQRSGLVIIQNPVGFRFGMDAVFLAEFATVRDTDRVIDLGTGTGVIPLLLWARRRPRSIVGVEILEDVADMAARSVKLNGLEEHISILQGDLRDAPARFGREQFDVVTANPPYMKAGCGILPGQASRAHDAQPDGAGGAGRAEARHEVLCTLEDVIASAAALLKSRGRLAMVYRPVRLVDLICALRARKLEPRRIRFVHGRAELVPMMVLVEAVKNVKPDLKVLPPLIIYGDNGGYTPEVVRIYEG